VWENKNMKGFYLSKKYNIAFSFEGRDRNKITTIKNYLEEKYNVKIFLDQHESGDLQSSNPMDRLYEIFKNDAKYVVVFLSKTYKNKISKRIDCSNSNASECYLKKEIEAIKYRIEKEGREFLKIVKLDRNVSLKDELKISDDVYYSFNDNLAETIAKDLILQRNKVNMKIGFYERIFHLFRLHDINEEEIPLLLNEWFDITYYDVLTNKENFQRKVTKEMIDFLALNFGIDNQWFYGNNVNLYKEEYGFYKNVKKFGDYIAKRKNQIEELYILTESTPDKKKDSKNDSNYIVIIAQYLKFNYPESNKPIYTYEIFNEDCRWGYWKCRYNFKSFLLYLRMKHNLGLTFYRGYTVPDVVEKFMKFNKGEMDFEALMSGGSMWHPEDYIYRKEDFHEAKETDEIEEVLEAIKKDEWSWF
jgi:hypothetical protein